MNVTVAVLTYNEEQNIPDILGSLEAQTYPPERFEVLVVDNGSTDATLDAIRPYAERMGNVRVIQNPVRGIAPGRNVAVDHATFDFVAFTDADVILSPTWLATLADGFSRLRERGEPVAAVGGGNVPVKDGGPFLDAAGITLNSFWGSHGSTQGMLFEKEQSVPHIPTLNILYDREILKKLGGFDEDFRMVCEDPELNHRLTGAGYKIFFLPDATVQHKMRPSLRSWLKNVFTYGRGRTQLIRKHPDHFAAMFLLPPVLVSALAIVPLTIWHPIFALPLLYFAIPAPIAASLCRRAGRWDCLPTAYVILTLNPIAYGLGMLWALVKKKT